MLIVFLSKLRPYSYTKSLEMSFVFVSSTASLLMACQIDFYFCLQHWEENNIEHSIFWMAWAGCTMIIITNVNIKDINMTFAL